MKKILLTGSTGFLGKHFKYYLEKNYPGEYEIVECNTKNNNLLYYNNFCRKINEFEDNIHSSYYKDDDKLVNKQSRIIPGCKNETSISENEQFFSNRSAELIAMVAVFRTLANLRQKNVASSESTPK